MDGSAWLLDAVRAFLKSPEYTTPVMNFIDEQCIVFDQDDESKLEFTKIHEEFISLVFGLLEGFLAELGVSQEEFAKECQKALSFGGESAFVYHQIMAVEDFPSFKRMMAKRNRELELELMRQMQHHQQLAGMIPMSDDGAGVDGLTGHDDEEGEEDVDDLAAQEERELEAALRLSRMTFEHGDSEIEAKEAAEIEEAIRLSKLQSNQGVVPNFRDDVPDNEAAEQAMLERALAESLKNSAPPPPPPAAQAGAPAPVATLPPRKSSTTSIPPSQEELEQVKALPVVTDKQIAALQIKHEIAVVEHALAISEALEQSTEESEDEDFLGAAKSAAAPAAQPAPLAPLQTPIQEPTAPDFIEHVEEESRPATATEPASRSKSPGLLPDIKPTPGSSFPSLARPTLTSKEANLAGMDVEELDKLERKEQKRREKERRAKEKALLAKKASELQEAAAASEEGIDPAELEMRKKHLQEQRQRLLEAKKKEREEALDKAVSNKKHGEGVAADMLQKKASLAMQIGGEIVAAVREADMHKAAEHPATHADGEPATALDAERKRAELRKALSQRIKDDLSAMS